MSLQPLVSIVIPVYNGARYLREAVDSALAQTYSHVEVLVINDGSTDGGATEQIARSYGDRIRYFQKPNGGVATALNEGIRLMRGEYFSWLSHDDVYYPEKLATQVSLLGEPEIILHGDLDQIDANGTLLRHDSVAEYSKMSTLAALVLGWPINGCTTLIPRACFSQVGNFDESLRTTQDCDLWMRLARRYRFVHIARPLIKSRIHPAQGSRTILVHAKENDEFYSRALLAQTEESLLSIPGVKSMADGYLKMAQALTWRKRALTASNLALRLALNHAETVRSRAAMAALFGANVSLELPLYALRRVRRYLAVRKAR